MLAVYVAFASVFFAGVSAGVAVAVAWKSEVDLRRPAADTYRQMHLTLDLMESTARKIERAAVPETAQVLDAVAID